MRGYALRRLGQAALTLLGVSVLVFVVLRVLPGDPAKMLLPLCGPPLRGVPPSGLERGRPVALPPAPLPPSPPARGPRLTRSSMLEILGRDYIRTGRAKGLAERAVVLRHALRNAAVPVLT